MTLKGIVLNTQSLDIFKSSRKYIGSFSSFLDVHNFIHAEY